MSEEKNTFTLTRAHIDLIRRFGVKIRPDEIYDNEIVPVIDGKRPFGNSWMLGDILDVMGEKPDETGGFSDKQKMAAYLLLAELPAAFQTMMENSTFTPGTYPVRRHLGLTESRMAKNYVLALPLLNKIKNSTSLSRHYEQARIVCSSNMSEDPFRDLRSVLNWSRSAADTQEKVTVIDTILAMIDEQEADLKENSDAEPCTKPENTCIKYLYRDADNYKCHNHVIIPGNMTEEQIARLEATLNDGEYFIPQQVGLPADDMTSLGYKFDPQSDHPWFTMYPRTGISPTALPYTHDISPENLVQQFEKAHANGWDETLWDHQSTPSDI